MAYLIRTGGNEASCSKMREPHSVDDFISVLQKCRQAKNLAQAKQLHVYMKEKNAENHPVLGNYLVSMLIDCGDVLEARRVFDRLPFRSQYSWSSLIAGFVSYGDYDQAFHLYQKMQEEGVQTKNFTFRAMLKACSEMKDIESGQKLHAAIVEEGLEEDVFIGSTVVDMYGNCGLIKEACRVFDRFDSQDEVLWTVLISGYADQGLVEEVWRCLENMQLKGVCLDASTFVCCLKACVVDLNPEAGYKMHTEIVFKGLEQGLYVGHTLLDLYAKCGLLLEAQKIFESLPVKSVVSWTTLISGCTDVGLAEEALGCLEQMRLNGICPNDVTLLCGLKACTTIGAIHAGRELHLDVIKKGLDIDVFVGSTLIDMYAKCDCITESRKVLHLLPVRNSVAWNALLAGYVSYGLCSEAIDSFEKMQQEDMPPAAITFVHALKACGEGQALTTGRALHDKVIKRGWEGNSDLSNTLVNFYGKCGHLLEARMLFDLLPLRSCASWTALISGYVENELLFEALGCFMEMQMEGIFLDKVIVACSLKACILLEAFEIGCIHHTLFVKQGWEKEHPIASLLVSMYAKCGLLPEAQEMLNKMEVQSVEAWTFVLVEYIQHGHQVTAMEHIYVMQRQGLSPTGELFLSMLKACSSPKALKTGQVVHTEVTKRGLEIEADMGKMLVDVYSKCGMLQEASHSFEKLVLKDAVSWTSLIIGFTEQGHNDKALDYIEQMRLEDVSPLVNTFVFGLKACGMTGVLKTGRKFCIEVLRRGWENNIYICTALVDMYAKCSSCAEARYWLLRFPYRTSATWNALIAGYADHGLGDEALTCYTEMQFDDVYPVGVTYVCVLKACGLVEALETGCKVHMDVLKRGLEGDSFLCTAMVDMYAKCGKFEEAQKSFNSSSFQDVTAWNALLKGSGENHQGPKALQYFEKMREQGVKPNEVTYILLLAICSNSNMVTEGQEYFKQMLEQGIKPTLDHCTCMVDLIARAGSIQEAEEFAKAHHCLQNGEVLRALLTSCKLHNEVVLGEKLFAKLLELDQEDAAAYLLMADIYISAGMWTDAKRVEAARIKTAAAKMPAKGLIHLKAGLSEYEVGSKRSEDLVDASSL